MPFREAVRFRCRRPTLLCDGEAQVVCELIEDLADGLESHRFLGRPRRVVQGRLYTGSERFEGGCPVGRRVSGETARVR